MDRNQAIGLTLIFAILFGYFTFFAPKPEPPKKGLGRDTLSAANVAGKPAANRDVKTGGAGSKLSVGDSAQAAPVPAQTYNLANNLLDLAISNQGAQIEEATLKNYKTYGGRPLHVITPGLSNWEASLETAAGLIKTSGLVFTPASKTDTSMVLVSRPTGGPVVEVGYALHKGSYKIATTIRVDGRPIKAGRISWAQELALTEKDLTQSRQAATVNAYTKEESLEYLNETSADDQELILKEPIAWINHKQKFFSAAMIAGENTRFNNVKLNSSLPGPADSTIVKAVRTQANLSATAAGVLDFSFYLGPNDYKILKTVAPDFERNVYLGWPVIRWVNKYIVINVFHFLQGFISNYGIIIVLLVLFIRLLLLPLGYRSYISMAKMRVLKPEIDAIKERVGDDQVAVQQEQMKLYQQVGINPISGCIPLLLQMPILLAMFNFFPNSIELRQEHLWWAEDLSAWDSIATLPFAIPSYGTHVSLFTILMTISTLAVTYVNNQSGAAAAAVGPMQSLSYIMPVVFMFILNSLPAGLSFYYLVSNLVSMGQQFLIKRTVNDEAIRAKLEQNKTKIAEKKPGKFATRLQEALRQAEEAKRQTPSSKKK